jgi:hypothetical protein
MTLKVGDFCEATKKILAYRLPDGGDEWILPGTRMMIFKGKEVWPPHPAEHLYYEIKANANRYKVFDHDIEGRVKNVETGPV